MRITAVIITVPIFKSFIWADNNDSSVGKDMCSSKVFLNFLSVKEQLKKFFFTVSFLFFVHSEVTFTNFYGLKLFFDFVFSHSHDRHKLLLFLPFNNFPKPLYNFTHHRFCSLGLLLSAIYSWTRWHFEYGTSGGNSKPQKESVFRPSLFLSCLMPFSPQNI